IKSIDVRAFEFLQRDIPECGNDVSAEVLRIPLASFVCREGWRDIDEPVARVIRDSVARRAHELSVSTFGKPLSEQIDGVEFATVYRFKMREPLARLRIEAMIKFDSPATFSASGDVASHRLRPGLETSSTALRASSLSRASNAIFSNRDSVSSST